MAAKLTLVLLLATAYMATVLDAYSRLEDLYRMKNNPGDYKKYVNYEEDEPQLQYGRCIIDCYKDPHWTNGCISSFGGRSICEKECKQRCYDMEEEYDQIRAPGKEQKYAEKYGGTSRHNDGVSRHGEPGRYGKEGLAAPQCKRCTCTPVETYEDRPRSFAL